MRLVRILLLCSLVCSKDPPDSVLGDNIWDYKYLRPVTENWRIPFHPPGGCDADQVEYLNGMWKQMQDVRSRFDKVLKEPGHWDDPPQWFRGLSRSIFGVLNWEDPSFDDKKKVMRFWMEYLSRILQILPKPDERHILLCDSDLMEMKLPERKLQKLSQNLKKVFGKSAFEKWWWFQISGLTGIEDAWVRFPKDQYPIVTHDSQGVGLPFQTRPDKPDSPTYCAGVREPGDALALTISLEKRPSSQPTDYTKDGPLKILILCPKIFQDPAQRIRIEGDDAPGTPLQHKRPAWLPWFHELLHMKQEEHVLPNGEDYIAHDAYSRLISDRSLRTPGLKLSNLQKSMFEKQCGRTWDVASCFALGQYEMADPITLSGYGSETLRNPESWAWFATAVCLTGEGPGALNWDTGFYGRNDLGVEEGALDLAPPYEHPPDIDRAAPAKRHVAQSSPVFPSKPLLGESYSSAASDILNTMLKNNLTEYRGFRN